MDTKQILIACMHKVKASTCDIHSENAEEQPQKATTFFLNCNNHIVMNIVSQTRKQILNSMNSIQPS